MSFEIFNQYRENRLIPNESDANLIQKAFAKRELFESTSHERETASVMMKIVQLKFFATISSLQTLQMLFRWLIIMLVSNIFETFFFRWIQHYEVSWSICEFVSKLRTREEKKNSSFVLLLWFYKWAVCENRNQCERLRMKRILQNFL